MAKIGPALGVPDMQCPSRDELREIWKRTIGTTVSNAALSDLDRALRLYLGAQAVQESRRILIRVERDAAEIRKLLGETIAEARTALCRIALRINADEASIVAFV